MRRERRRRAIAVRYILGREHNEIIICPSTVITTRSSKLFVSRLVGLLKMMAPLIESLVWILFDCLEYWKNQQKVIH
ncbi:hypothetical protein Goklo_012221, partial [Gossypium klotzschianum]|nr:hypothetical protein [Gossypium klotzschianum]